MANAAENMHVTIETPRQFLQNEGKFNYFNASAFWLLKMGWYKVLKDVNYHTILFKIGQIIEQTDPYCYLQSIFIFEV